MPQIDLRLHHGGNGGLGVIDLAEAFDTEGTIVTQGGEFVWSIPTAEGGFEARHDIGVVGGPEGVKLDEIRQVKVGGVGVAGGNKIALFQKWWIDRGYPDGIPDEADYNLEAQKKVPSWRRVCKSLLRNDYWCKGLSSTQHKSEAYEKYLKLMKQRREKWGI